MNLNVEAEFNRLMAEDRVRLAERAGYIERAAQAGKDMPWLVAMRQPDITPGIFTGEDLLREFRELYERQRRHHPEPHEHKLSIPTAYNPFAMLAKKSYHKVCLDEEDTIRTSQRKGHRMTFARETHFGEDIDTYHRDVALKARAHVWIYRYGRLDEDNIMELMKDFKTPEIQNELITMIEEQQKSSQMATNGQGTHRYVPLVPRETTKLYESMYAQMPLTIDQLLVPNEARAVDFVKIFSSNSDVAQDWRHFAKHKVMQYFEVTMQYRVMDFKDWRDPCYDIWETVGQDDVVRVSDDVGDVPTRSFGTRAMNAVPEYRPLQKGPRVKMSVTDDYRDLSKRQGSKRRRFL